MSRTAEIDELCQELKDRQAALAKLERNIEKPVLVWAGRVNQLRRDIDALERKIRDRRQPTLQEAA